MPIEIVDHFTVELCREFPDKVFVFGDNMMRRGKGGQAIIRDEPNAFGVATKRYPRNTENSFFSDQQNELDTMLNDLRRLFVKKIAGDTLVFPRGGLGTGLAQLQTRSPMIFAKLCDVLQKYFGFDNLGGI